MIRPRVFVSACVVVACALVSTMPAAAQQPPTSVPHTAELGTARVDVLANGKTVISIDTTGEMRGLLTLTLSKGENGLYGGEWAFMVSRVDTTDPATGVEPPDGHTHPAEAGVHTDTPHKDFLRLEHRGALSGTVAGAMLVLDQDGTLGAISATLAITQGAAEFNGVTGSGRLTLAGLTLLF
jgi:hypothetical protein